MRRLVVVRTSDRQYQMIEPDPGRRPRILHVVPNIRFPLQFKEMDLNQDLFS